MLYTMKEVCDRIGMTYETLKFYCNKGLVPNVKRDKNNHRVFDESDIKWIESLTCLKKCGMSIEEIKQYLNLCLMGDKSILERKEMLKKTQERLKEKLKEIQDSIDFIDWKQNYYDEILSGKTEDCSNLIDTNK